MLFCISPIIMKKLIQGFCSNDSQKIWGISSAPEDIPHLLHSSTSKREIPTTYCSVTPGTFATRDKCSACPLGGLVQAHFSPKGQPPDLSTLASPCTCPSVTCFCFHCSGGQLFHIAKIEKQSLIVKAYGNCS